MIPRKVEEMRREGRKEQGKERGEDFCVEPEAIY
jgi:hypothetical protein